jgi:hypothetical protein
MFVKHRQVWAIIVMLCICEGLCKKQLEVLCFPPGTSSHLGTLLLLGVHVEVGNKATHNSDL